MLGVHPKMVDAKVGKAGATVKVPDYWEKSKALLNNYKKYLQSLEHYAKDDIPVDRIAKI